MYVYYLRNKVTQHPGFNDPFFGRAAIPDYSHFEICKKYYSTTVKGDKNENEIKNENKDFFLKMGIKWPSINKAYAKKKKKNYKQDYESYKKLKAFNLPNPNWEKLGGEITKFYNDIVSPFLIKIIDQGKNDNVCF